MISNVVMTGNSFPVSLARWRHVGYGLWSDENIPWLMKPNFKIDLNIVPHQKYS